MAKQKKTTKTVTLYSPSGSKVTVAEHQADRLKGRGYSTTKSKSS